MDCYWKRPRCRLWVRTCSLDHYLVQPDETMDARIAAAREKLGAEAVLLGHHYQRDEVIRFADFTGDSYKLSKAAAEIERAVHGLLRRALYGGDGGHSGSAVAAGGAARPERGLLDGRHGRDRAGGGLLGVDGAAEGDGRRGDSAADVYELGGGDQGVLRRTGRAGVYLVQCAGRV